MTAIICALTPAAVHVEESHSTLRFACRAKRVVNNAVVNEVLSDAAVLKRQAREIEELKSRLSSQARSASGGHGDVVAQIEHLRGEMLRSEQEKELMRVKLQEEVAEREKAQKQVEVAKAIMRGEVVGLGGGGGGGGGAARSGNTSGVGGAGAAARVRVWVIG